MSGESKVKARSMGSAQRARTTRVIISLMSRDKVLGQR